MPVRQKYNTSSPVKNTLCPFWNSGILVIGGVGAIPLSGQPYLGMKYTIYSHL
jgi:hypothetical protein